MPSQSRPDKVPGNADVVLPDVDIAPIVDDVEVDEEDGDVFQYSSSDTSGISEPISAVCSDKGETLFSPPLYLQRYQEVISYLTTLNITTVLDTGCNNCKFLKHLQTLDSLKLIAGVDIDKGLLEEQGRFLAPLPADWLHGRKEELCLEVWWGSVGDRLGAKVMSGRFEAVTSIEIIEHLDKTTLDEFPHTVLGEIRPVVWIVSTPNREYNTLFPDWVGPFRHWDHRFEWDREEFRDWVEKVLSMYRDYTVEFGGVGFTPGCEESHGPCSQIAVFRRIGETVEVNELTEESSWEKLSSYIFPKKVDSRTRKEKIHDEAIYYARMMAGDAREKEYVEGNILVEIEDLLRFDGLSKITEDTREICNILEESGFEVDFEKVGVNIPADPSGDFSDDEYEYWEEEFDDNELQEVEALEEEEWA